ncbi:hypothetical protein [Parafilimonas sp.]|uniref:hypothetical protein n=1 Tax=Parafilimonas sp. TaxID=1969739 RepID=UPI0039E53D1D
MLKNISWSDYFITVAIILVIYYFFVGVRYFSGDLKDLLSGKRKLQFKTARSYAGKEDEAAVEEENNEETDGFEQTTDDEFEEVEHLIERLKTVIADDSGKRLIKKDEFKQYISAILKEYPSIKYSPLRSSINEWIISECEKNNAVTLREEEMDDLWQDTV